MKIKKTIWIPAVIGMVAATLIILASEAHFLIPVSNKTSIGIGEIFTTLSAALGGPLASFVTLLLVYGIVGLYHPEFYPDMTSWLIMLVDAFAHLCAMLVIAIAYYKWLYPHVRKTATFLLGWFLIVGAFYYLALLPLSVVLLNLADPGFGATYPTFAKNFIPEYLGTATITALIWFASPKYFRRPRWGKLNQEPDSNHETKG